MPDRPTNHWKAATSSGRLKLAPCHTPQRILFDTSYTLSSGKTSGIERVVSNLRQELASTAALKDAAMSTLYACDGRFFKISTNAEKRIRQIAQARADVLGTLPKLYRQVVVPLARNCGSRKVSKWFAPERGHLGLFRLPYRIWCKRAMQKLFRQADPIQPGPGDLLVLPDAYWTRMDIWPEVAAARERGAFVATVVYDLIPITHPEFVGQRRTEKFRGYMSQVAKNSDLILTISETVREDVAKYCAEHLPGDNYCHNIASFPLGAEFSTIAKPTASPPEIRPEVLNAFASAPESNPYLMVAAFDPRKNHAYLLDAFDKLWKQGSDRKLSLVGRFGSRCEGVIERIKQHPRLGSDLLIFQDLSDAELHYCYQRSRGVIFPSIVEGFGLPIVEALWHGKPTYASDTAIHREVGGDACHYFDLDNVDSLIDTLLQGDKLPAPTTEIRPTTWKESAAQFAELCLDHFAKHQRENTATPVPLLQSA